MRSWRLITGQGHQPCCGVGRHRARSDQMIRGVFVARGIPREPELRNLTVGAVTELGRQLRAEIVEVISRNVLSDRSFSVPVATGGVHECSPALRGC